MEVMAAPCFEMKQLGVAGVTELVGRELVGCASEPLPSPGCHVL